MVWWLWTRCVWEAVIIRKTEITEVTFLCSHIHLIFSRLGKLIVLLRIMTSSLMQLLNSIFLVSVKTWIFKVHASEGEITKKVTSRTDNFLVQKLPFLHGSVMSAPTYHKSLNAVLLVCFAIPVPISSPAMLTCGWILLYTCHSWDIWLKYFLFTGIFLVSLIPICMDLWKPICDLWRAMESVVTHVQPWPAKQCLKMQVEEHVRWWPAIM